VNRRLEDLDPRFRPQAEELVRRLTEAGVPCMVYETIRSAEDQAAAFARGASRCDGVKRRSKHQDGLALDIVALNSAGIPTWDYRRYSERYKRIGDIARELGLECGQDWHPSEYDDVGLGWDPPHYEYKE
jgi:hypothetical protein